MFETLSHLGFTFVSDFGFRYSDLRGKCSKILIGGLCLFSLLFLLSCSSSSTGPDEIEKAYAVYADSLENDTLRVGSLNLAVGFSFEDIIWNYPSNEAEAFTVLDEMYQEYLASRPLERLKIIAKEIVRQKPHVIALQEVMTISKNGIEHADFLTLLLEEIEKDSGPEYTAVLQSLNRQILGPYSESGDAITLDFIEGNAFLIDPAFTLLDSQFVLYDNLFSFPFEVLGMKFISERGFCYSKIQSPAGKRYQLYNTHIEAFGSSIQNDQVIELLDFVTAAENDHEVQIMLGDFNVEPGEDIYQIVREDYWIDTQDDLPESPSLTGQRMIVLRIKIST